MKKQDRDRAIWMLHKAGAEYGELAETFGLSRSHVGSICQMLAGAEKREERRRLNEEFKAERAERELLLAVADYVLDTYQPTRAEKAERIRELIERMAGSWDTDTE